MAYDFDERMVPLPVQSILNTRACKGAIKFGDRLSPETLADLIRRLSACSKPFQCAHGRPSSASSGGGEAHTLSGNATRATGVGAGLDV